MFWQIIVLLVLLIPLLAIVLDSQVGQALAARLERRRLGGPEDLSDERLAYLEGEVDRLGSELNRLAEESEFLHKLLTERAESTTEPDEGKGRGPGALSDGERDG